MSDVKCYDLCFIKRYESSKRILQDVACRNQFQTLSSLKKEEKQVLLDNLLSALKQIFKKNIADRRHLVSSTLFFFSFYY